MKRNQIPDTSNQFRRESGFSLVEVMIVQFTLVILLASVYWLWNTILQASSQSQQGMRFMSEMTSDLRVMTDHIREARDGEDGAYPLFLAEDDEVGIYVDIDGDLNTERVRYFLDGAELKRGVVTASGDPPTYNLDNEVITVVGVNIRNGVEPVFYYYNQAWPGDTVNNPLTLGNRLLHTRYVEALLRVGLDDDLGGKQETLSTSVQLRNLKENY